MCEASQSKEKHHVSVVSHDSPDRLKAMLVPGHRAIEHRATVRSEIN